MAAMTGQWQLGEEIGRGALGRVVRVHGPGGAVCAGKILHPSHRSDAAAQARFTSEAALLADLDHANVVHVLGLAEIDGEQVLCMELVDGPSLATVIARHAPLPAARAAALARGIAAGLAAAHRAGLIHRDLKPANVLVAADDTAKIADFGMARAASLAGVDPGAFAVAGTPDYMAPEVIDPLAVDVRSDLYALGCILYEMLAGRPPFTGATAFAVLEAHRTAPVPELAARGDAAPVPPALRDLVRALLAKSPADRPQSATAVREALDAVARGLTTSPQATRDHAHDDEAGAPAAPRGPDPAGAAGACAACGRPLVAGVPVCFACGTAQPTLAPGRTSVFVIGPGELAGKLPSEPRQRLLAWLRANPTLGLDPAPLARHVPRLPFVLATGVSEPSARALASAVESLGLTCAVTRGNRFALASMRRKAWRLSGRVGLIATSSGFLFVMHAAALGSSLLVAGLAGSVVAGWHLAGRRAVRVARRPGPALPEVIARALARVAAVLPAIDRAHHRDSLRAVVQRALDLREVMGGPTATGLDADIARLIDLAVVASARIDELERTLSPAALARPTAALRAMLRERDAWAARLLETTAHLDALRMRWAALRHAGATHDADERLADLRAHIEALEEIQT